MEKTIDLASKAAEQNDRALFLLALILLGVFAIFIMRYFMQQNALLMADHKESRVQHLEAWQKATERMTTATTESTEVIRECTNELRRCNETRQFHRAGHE